MLIYRKILTVIDANMLGVIECQESGIDDYYQLFAHFKNVIRLTSIS